ncbi:MAG: hypothetical protein JJU12_06580 [Chlamydiales bacterium]|nr:hypothetical protein [Chlamydiales bacterium]
MRIWCCGDSGIPCPLTSEQNGTKCPIIQKICDVIVDLLRSLASFFCCIEAEPEADFSGLFASSVPPKISERSNLTGSSTLKESSSEEEGGNCSSNSQSSSSSEAVLTEEYNEEQSDLDDLVLEGNGD